MRHVVVDQLETSSLGEVADVLPPSGAEIVDAHNRGTGVEQRVTQVGSDETGTTKYDRAIKVPCCPAHVSSAFVSRAVQSMPGPRPGA
jgi:hypothetical protein